MKVSLREPFSSYIIHRLGIDEQVKSFDCGDADLNDFILNDSGLYRKSLLSVSYVFEAPGDVNHEQIAAYFSLANDRVSLSDFPCKTAFNRFRRHRFVNEKRLKSYPAVKICRIKYYFLSDNKTGCRFLTVDAYAAALPFYFKNGFEPLNEEDKNEPTRLLYFDLASIEWSGQEDLGK